MIGQLLVAPPAQTDDYWAQSVVFLYEETAKASVGIILNKRSDRTFRELAEHHDLDYDGDELLYIGGPVNPSALVMLHTDDWSCTNTMHVTGNLRLSSDRTMLKRLCEGDRPAKWRLFLGMSAWTPEQLAGEISGIAPWNKKTAWLTAPSETKLIFDAKPERIWKKSIDLAAAQMVGSFFNIS